MINIEAEFCWTANYLRPSEILSKMSEGVPDQREGAPILCLAGSFTDHRRQLNISLISLLAIWVPGTPVPQCSGTLAHWRLGTGDAFHVSLLTGSRMETHPRFRLLFFFHQSTDRFKNYKEFLIVFGKFALQFLDFMLEIFMRYYGLF